MIRSESIVKVSAALVAAQGMVARAVKDAENPHFRSKYADLESVWSAIEPALKANKLALIQVGATPPSTGYLALETIILHESGEYIGGVTILPLPKADPQGFGSGNTYARRYGAASIMGVVFEDDDAEAATPKEKTQRPALEQDRGPRVPNARIGAPPAPPPEASDSETKHAKGRVESVEATPGTGKSGRPYVKYYVRLSDGSAGSSFSETVGKIAAKAKASGETVLATFKKSGKFWNLEALNPASADLDDDDGDTSFDPPSWEDGN